MRPYAVKLAEFRARLERKRAPEPKPKVPRPDVRTLKLAAKSHGPLCECQYCAAHWNKIRNDRDRRRRDWYATPLTTICEVVRLPISAQSSWTFEANYRPARAKDKEYLTAVVL